MFKKIFCLVLAAVLCCTPALAAPAPEHHVAAKAAILYELSTDTVLLEQDADMKLFPASTTKLMTAIVAMEYGNPQDVVTVTAEAVDGLFELGSASYLLAGEEIAFMDLMRYLLIGSGNDAANALAIHVSGSLDGFVELMNNKARELGCTTVALTSNPNTAIAAVADIAIVCDTGPEAVTGSTRLKAGNSQKFVLNMLSTGAMIKTGKVYENLMINLKPSNVKLKGRVVRITAAILDCGEEEATALLEKNDWNIRKAVESVK